MEFLLVRWCNYCQLILLKLVVVSYIVASPTAWLALHNWLQHYKYLTNIV